MTTRTPRQQQQALQRDKLQQELMPIIRTGLEDDDVIEIMANPNGEIWFDRLSCGVERTGMVFSETQIETIIGTIAHWHGVVVHREAPRLRAELPLDGSRFQGLLRPVSPPTFVIRKHLKQVISLDEQVAAGTLTPAQAATLHAAINARNNIAIVGGTLSGKTVLANTVIDAMVQAFGESLRLVLIEDTYELRCTAPNVVHLHTSDTVSTQQLVQDALRLRPDRIIVGEVRGAEAWDLLKSWNTGHPGGVTTVHADTAPQAMDRLEALIEEAGIRPNPRILANTVHLIVQMVRLGSREWRVQEIVRCHGWNGHHYEFEGVSH
jgi:type IV secretion system protein VirB11